MVTGRQAVVPTTERPVGETTYGASAVTFGRTPALTLADILSTVPGVSFITGSGPRDIAISIRGSYDRQASPLRNIRVLEDGFPETQPDGDSRTDLVDPRLQVGRRVRGARLHRVRQLCGGRRHQLAHP